MGGNVHRNQYLFIGCVPSKNRAQRSSFLWTLPFFCRLGGGRQSTIFACNEPIALPGTMIHSDNPIQQMRVFFSQYVIAFLFRVCPIRQEHQKPTLKTRIGLVVNFVYSGRSELDIRCSAPAVKLALPQFEHIDISAHSHIVFKQNAPEHRPVAFLRF